MAPPLRSAPPRPSRFRSPAVEQRARAAEQHLAYPGEVHEVLADALARGVYARACIRDRALHVGMARIARMTERLREVHHAEREVVDAIERGELVRGLDAGAALDHQTERHGLVACRDVRRPVVDCERERPSADERPLTERRA